MKFLTFVDLHADKRVLKELVTRAKEDDIDFVVCAGDLSEFGNGLRFALQQFSSCNKPFYIIPGNHENDGMLADFEKEFSFFKNFNRQALVVDDYVLLGHGEGGFAQEDPEFRKLAREWYGKYNGKKIVFVMHGPPYGTKIDLMEKIHVGNNDYRKFIERIKPKLVVCGHIHETANVVDEINGIKVINPGWEGMVIELP